MNIIKNFIEFNIIVGYNYNSVIKTFNINKILKVILRDIKINIIEFKFFFLFNFIFKFNNTFNIIKNTFGNTNNFIKNTNKGRNSITTLIGGLSPIFNYYFIRVFIFNKLFFNIKFRLNSRRNLIAGKGRGGTLRINIGSNYNKR